MRIDHGRVHIPSSAAMVRAQWSALTSGAANLNKMDNLKKPNFQEATRDVPPISSLYQAIHIDPRGLEIQLDNAEQMWRFDLFALHITLLHLELIAIHTNINAENKQAQVAKQEFDSELEKKVKTKAERDICTRGWHGILLLQEIFKPIYSDRLRVSQQNQILGQDVSIDEQLVLFKDQSRYTILIPSNWAWKGFKIYSLCPQ